MTGIKIASSTCASNPPAIGSVVADQRIAATSGIVSLRGLINYTDALDLQYTAQVLVQQGCLPNTLYLLEHPAVVTIGRSAGLGDKDLLTTRAVLSARGIAVIDADRGGDTTYHAPGQLVGYSIVDLQPFGKDLHWYIRSLESLIIGALAEFGVECRTIPGLTGVWACNRKIAAIGIKVSRWVSMHGFSINIDADLDVMRKDIVPCGISDRGVVSLREMGISATRESVEASIARQWKNLFGGNAPCTLMPRNLFEEFECLHLLSRTGEGG